MTVVKPLERLGQDSVLAVTGAPPPQVELAEVVKQQPDHDRGVRAEDLIGLVPGQEQPHREDGQG
jgi:hypothetical protein